MQLQKKTRKINATALAKNLSIQFSLDGFSFCISNKDTKEPIVFTQYTFSTPVSSPQLLLSNIIEVFKKDEDLQQEFSSVFAIHQNDLATIVPTPLFDRNNAKAYLNYSVKTLATDFISYDTIEAITATNVYIPYVNINNYLFQNFGEFEYKHHVTVLIEKLLKQTTSTNKVLYVHVNTSSIDIIVCNNEQLFLSNTFPYKTEEDFLYYILFVAEQLEMHPNSLDLVFLGDITKNDALYNIAYIYIRNIRFIDNNTTFFTSSTKFNKHTHYILVS